MRDGRVAFDASAASGMLGIIVDRGWPPTTALWRASANAARMPRLSGNREGAAGLAVGSMLAENTEPKTGPVAALTRETAGFRGRYFAQPYAFAVYLLLIALSVVALLTFNRYGFAMDDENGYRRAVRIINLITSLGAQAEDVARFEPVNLYGAMPDVLALVLQRLVPGLSFDSRHLIAAIFGIAGVFYTYHFAATFIRPAVGFFAGLFLACNPMWFGYMFINLKDVPFSTTLMASLYYSLSAMAGRSKSPWIWPQAALAIGLLATTKIIGVVILGFVCLVIFACDRIIHGGISPRIDRRFVQRLLGLMVCGLVGCLVCFALFWPQFYFYSPRQLANVVQAFANYDIWKSTVQIDGQHIPYDRIPWYYLSLYWAISMPIFLLAMAGAGAAYGLMRREPIVASLTIVCILFFAYQAVTGARVYNGYRHFLFLLPFAMIIAAYPIGLLMETGASTMIRTVALLVVGVALGAVVLSMYRLFPYQYSFYNVFVGGVPGADGKYYIDVWRSALGEALRKIEDDLAPSKDAIRVHSCGSNVNYLAHPRVRSVSFAEADYIVALRRGCPPELYNGLPIAAEIRREGVVFAVIYAR